VPYGPPVTFLALALLAAQPDAAFVSQSRDVMHTLVTVSLPASVPEAQRTAAFDEAFAVFEHIDQDLNEWRPESALSRVNDGAGGAAVPASADLCEVVAAALDGARRTDGLFDPSWAALRGLWRFGTDATGELPKPDALAAACKLVGWRDVELVPAKAPTPAVACTIRLKKKGMRLGLGGLVKGWGVDRVVKRLRARGLTDFFVQAGGDLYLAGRRGDRPWRSGIRDPRGGPQDFFASLEVSDAAFSTSGDYEHFFVKDGVRYHHLIDLRTCEPARASLSTTVLAKSALDAEFLTKAAFVLGPVEGQKLVQRFGAEAAWVLPDGSIRTTPGLDKRLQLLRAVDAGVR
jgi:thiamine biosynthesis lipoprotein